jgi:hypothetical protein
MRALFRSDGPKDPGSACVAISFAPVRSTFAASARPLNGDVSSIQFSVTIWRCVLGT